MPGCKAPEPLPISCVAGVSSVLLGWPSVTPERLRMGAGRQKDQAVMGSLWLSGTSALPTLQEVAAGGGDLEWIHSSSGLHDEESTSIPPVWGLESCQAGGHGLGWAERCTPIPWGLGHTSPYKRLLTMFHLYPLSWLWLHNKPASTRVLLSSMSC